MDRTSSAPPVPCRICGTHTTASDATCNNCFEIENRARHLGRMIRESEEFAEAIILALELSGRVATVVRAGDSISQPIVMVDDIHLGSVKDDEYPTIDELKNQLADEMARVFGAHWYIEEIATR